MPKLNGTCYFTLILKVFFLLSFILFLNFQADSIKDKYPLLDLKWDLPLMSPGHFPDSDK